MIKGLHGLIPLILSYNENLTQEIKTLEIQEIEDLA